MPAGLLGFVLLGLTCLPMASCGGGGKSNIVPARIVVELARPADSGPPLTVAERLSKFLGGVPILFLITWPYWTAAPAALPWLFALHYPQHRFRQRLVAWLWRTSILLLILGTQSLGFAALDERGIVMILVGGAALLIWIASSPASTRAAQWTCRRTVLRHRHGTWRTWQHPVVGGCWSLAIQCFLSVASLAWHGSSLLLGGQLAAGVNVALGVVLLATARQFKTDRRRAPRFSIQDLLIAVTMTAIFMAINLALQDVGPSGIIKIEPAGP